MMVWDFADVPPFYDRQNFRLRMPVPRHATRVRDRLNRLPKRQRKNLLRQLDACVP